MELSIIDKNGDGYIDLSELKEALDICGFKLPGWKVRKMIEDYDNKRQITHKGRLSFEEFEMLCGELKGNEVASTFKQVVSKKENLETLGGMSDASSEGTTHSVRLEEQLAFSDWITTNLGSDPDLRHLLPIDPEGKSLYDKTVFPLLNMNAGERMFGRCLTHTATGRISMHEPNLQNIPRDFDISAPEGSDVAVSMRLAFVPSKGKCFVSADYSQLELRLLAHFSGDTVLRSILNSGQDVFTSIAAAWNKIPHTQLYLYLGTFQGIHLILSLQVKMAALTGRVRVLQNGDRYTQPQVTFELRQRAKQICYGMIYGMGARALAEQLEVEESVAVSFMTSFNEAYPGVKKFLFETIAKCRRQGYVETLRGRRRYLPAITSSNSLQKTSVGGYGHVRRMEKERIPRRVMKLKYEGKGNQEKKWEEQVSDKHVMEAVRIIKSGMEEAVNLSVKLPVKVRTGNSWGALREITL
uniref:DNA-directed DNA polymerase n=1 Tax=Timema bartmani TaxID=61472 RepID=A0A7R9FA24_9NEOP|nr:unnamed protein product [Timema bartmani]